MSKPRVTIESPKGGYGLGKNAWDGFDAAVSVGGQQTWDLARVSYKVKEMCRSLGEHYKKGNLGEYLIEGEDHGKPILFAIYGDVSLTIRHVGKRRVEDRDGGPHWILQSRATISDKGLTAADVSFYADLLEASAPVLVVVLRQIGKGIASFFASCRAVEDPADVSSVMSEAIDDSEAAVEETEEAEVSCKGMLGLAGLALIAASLIVENLLSNVMHHKLIVYNATDLDLHWEIAHLDAGVVFQVPRPFEKKDGHVGGTVGKIEELFGDKVGKYGQFCSQSSSFAEGLGYLLRFKPADGLPHGAWAKVQVPYYGDNSVRVSLVEEEGGAGAIWDRWTDSHQAVTTKAELGDLTMKMSQDYLSGTHFSSDLPRKKGYFYTSILTFHKKGIWGEGEG